MGLTSHIAKIHSEYELPFYYPGQNVSVKDLDLEAAFEERQLSRNHEMDEYDLVNWGRPVEESEALFRDISCCEKPAFRWLGVNRHLNTKSLALDTSNSKSRAFGTDITNYTDTKRYRMDSSSDWSSKCVRLAMHRNIDCVKLEHDENITMLQQP
ncbi:hypothetical protein Tco_1098575 [Tanacetum coccineum]